MIEKIQRHIFRRTKELSITLSHIYKSKAVDMKIKNSDKRLTRQAS